MTFIILACIAGGASGTGPQATCHGGTVGEVSQGGDAGAVAVIDNGRPRKNANPDSATSKWKKPKHEWLRGLAFSPAFPHASDTFARDGMGWIRLGLPDRYAMRYLVGHGNGGTVITDPGRHLKFGQCGSSSPENGAPPVGRRIGHESVVPSAASFQVGSPRLTADCPHTRYFLTLTRAAL